MRFGLYCNNFSDLNLEAVDHLVQVLKKVGLEYSFNSKLAVKLKENKSVYNDKASLEKLADILLTVGGDGTILSTIQYIYGSQIPVIGVNTGRLGYLTSISAEEFEPFLDEINQKQFQIEERSLIEVETTEAKNGKKLALNEVSVLKKDSSSMITIHAWLDGELLNTYWADGLIISTATGSTAYSLSCGGPIMAPGSGNLIITPIAPHNLNVRPLVIPDSSEIELRIESRSGDFLMALDSTTRFITEDIVVKIRKAPKKIRLLRSNQYSYLETLRSKLNWGLDRRN